jgi:hypothetical protein
MIAWGLGLLCGTCLAHNAAARARGMGGAAATATLWSKISQNASYSKFAECVRTADPSLLVSASTVDLLVLLDVQPSWPLSALMLP